MKNDATIYAVNRRRTDAAEHDYYATEPRAVEMLLELEDFSSFIWEPACGEGHISKVLGKHGYRVMSTDLIDRGFGTGCVDFLKCTSTPASDYDIITNPPYEHALEFVEKALELVAPGRKVAMFLKLTFLESVKRRDLFKNTPPMTVYVSSDRLKCGKNGDFTGPRSAVAYCWFVWKKGHTGPTYIKWFN